MTKFTLKENGVKASITASEAQRQRRMTIKCNVCGWENDFPWSPVNYSTATSFAVSHQLFECEGEQE